MCNRAWDLGRASLTTACRSSHTALPVFTGCGATGSIGVMKLF